jgi:IclR family pca regulon transcriptional regulator
VPKQGQTVEIDQRDYVQSLERGLAIIEAFDADTPTLTLAQAAARTGLNRAAARRFLLTLAHLGYIDTDGKQFWLHPRILNLGYRYLTSQAWWHVAQPILEDIARETQETCSLCVLDETEVVYVSRVVVSRIIATNLSVGSRLPAYPTAIGRALLSQLSDPDLTATLAKMQPIQHTDYTITSDAKLRKVIEKARVQGYAAVDQELAIGLLGLAVPLRTGSGTGIAALGISVQAGRVPFEQLAERYLPLLQSSATRIAASVASSRRHEPALG